MATIEQTPNTTTIPTRVRRDRSGSKNRRRRRMSPIGIEVFSVFLICFAAYMGLGWRIVHDQHLIVFDATARLAHAYFVFWNAPPKLASIGFVWAPLSTLVFLPAVVIKPLATSLVALTVTSGAFAALMMALLVRFCAFLGMPRWQRLTLIAVFAVNPMILYYAVNGMSEAPYLCLLTAALYFFVRWFVDEESHWLFPCGVAMTFAVLSRYEVFGYAVVLLIAVPVTLMIRRRSQDEVEGSTIAFFAPVVYGLGLWIFFNWLIIGDPLFWLHEQIGIGGGSDPLSTAATSAASVGAAAAPGRGELFGDLLRVNALLFPLVLASIPALLVTWGLSLRKGTSRLVAKNGLMAFWMVLLVSTNALFTGLLLIKSPDSNLLQLRYNMRAMPVAVMGLVWLWYSMPGARSRLAVWGAGIAILLATLPFTWHVMNTWQYQYEENIFTKALRTGQDQEGNNLGGPYTIGNADDREMAQYILKSVPRSRDGILTDDGQTFGVMLATGHPEYFRDRIDKGDASWKRVLSKPWGHVDYLLVARYPLPPAGIVDEIQKRYPGVRTESLPGVSVEHANGHYVLLRVSRTKPTAKPSRFDGAFDKAKDVSVPRL